MGESRRIGIDILADAEEDDPILSVVNVVDVFLVVIAVLLIAIAENPLNPFVTQDVVVIRNPDSPQMELVIKKGQALKRYRASGRIGEGEGQKAGTAYRLKDGTMIYVPEQEPRSGSAAGP